MRNDVEQIKLSNGATTILSRNVYCNVYLEFDEWKESFFGMMIHNGVVFPTIIQYIYVIFSLCTGHTSFRDIMLITISSGVFYMLMWYLIKMHRWPINSICFVIEHIILKFRLQWIPIILISLAVVRDWKTILYCVIAAIISCALRMIMFMLLSNVRYNNKVAIYVSKMRNKS